MGNGDIPYYKKDTKTVSEIQQVGLTLFIPFYWIYALYRINKLSLGTVVYVSSFVVFWGLIVGLNIFQSSFGWMGILFLYFPVIVLLYFIVRWTRKFNEQFPENS